MTGVPAVASTVPPDADVTSERREADRACLDAVVRRLHEDRVKIVSINQGTSSDRSINRTFVGRLGDEHLCSQSSLPKVPGKHLPFERGRLEKIRGARCNPALSSFVTRTTTL